MILKTNFSKIVEYLTKKGAKKLFYGCDRVAMCRGNAVYKIPRNDGGVAANLKEEYIFKKVCKHKEALVTEEKQTELLGFARCRLIHLFEIPVLIMEKVIPLLDDDFRRTEFVNQFDGGQLGEGRRGDFLFYDYSRFYGHKFKRNEIFEQTLKKINTTEFGWADVKEFDSCFGSVKDMDILRVIVNGGR